ncbi:MAG: hypothetical protein EXR79_12020 [Myxococcales bacterium]|nr:hypothetical protein [Myxococcales bacterium]
MRTTSWSMAAVATLVGATACTSDPAASAVTASAITWNAGLADNFVPWTAQRRKPVLDAIKQADSEVLCLQEVWLDDDVTRVVEAAKPKYPHAHFVKTVDSTVGGPPACNVTEVAPLKACAEKNCQGAGSLADCALTNCGAQYLATAAKCQDCLGANISLNNIGAIFQACAEGSGSLSFGGRNGVLLLSRSALAEKDVLKFDSFLLQRVVLYAKTKVGSGAAHVFCTHLQAGLGSVKYNGKAGGWKEEQAAEIDATIAFVKQKSAGQRALLLGDLNCGPELKGAGIDGEFPDNFMKFTTAGFRSRWLEQASPTCTWCDGNELAGKTTSRIIDHALLLGWSGGVGGSAGARAYDARVQIDLPSGPTQSYVSDHFGVRVTWSDGSP